MMMSYRLARRSGVPSLKSRRSIPRCERSSPPGTTEAKNAPLMERIAAPALNLRGIRGGNVNELSSNTIPTEATASIDFRLVPKQMPEHVRELVKAHVESHGY